jgi:predicted RNA-binding protein YlxR (DUF448 family)
MRKSKKPETDSISFRTTIMTENKFHKSELICFSKAKDEATVYVNLFDRG